MMPSTEVRDPSTTGRALQSILCYKVILQYETGLVISAHGTMFGQSCR